MNKIILEESKAKLFNDVIDTLCKRYPEITFEMKEDCIRANSMDASNIMFVDFTIGKDFFKEYTSDGGDSFSVHSDQLKNALKKVTGKGETKIDVTKDQIFVSNDTKKFTLEMLDIDMEKKKELPTLVFKSISKLSVGSFSEVISDSKIIKDCTTLKITSTDTKLNFLAEGRGKYESQMEPIKFEKKELADSRFNVDFLESTVCKGFDEVKMNIGKDYPIRLDYETDEKDFKLCFVLAPRVDND